MSNASQDYEVKILNLKCWNMPQTKSLFNDWKKHANHRAVSLCPGSYISFQSYHFVDICSTSDPRISNAYAEVLAGQNHYAGAGKDCAQSLCDDVHTVQSITMLGTKTDFWDEPADQLYITFIQLSNSCCWDLSEATNSVSEIIKKYDSSPDSETAWCLYYSLDFSDFILFTKNVSMEKYHNILWDLSQFREQGFPFVRDSFTLFCFGYNFLMEKFQEIAEDKDVTWDDTVSVSIHLSVQSLGTLNNFLSILQSIGEFRQYRLSGRYDYNIVFDSLRGADILKVLYSLDQLAAQRENTVFASYDVTFLIAPPKVPIEGIEAPQNHRLFNNASALLEVLCQEYSRCRNLHANYAEETRKALLTLLKRGFSDEFTVSILLSFITYLKVCIEAQNELNRGPLFTKSLHELKHHYFEAVNTLALCTMHSERQFIQAPAFNAPYFNVPPKLLAFYTAIVYELAESLKQEGEEQYRFLIVPDYRKDIYVSPFDVDIVSDQQEHIAIAYLSEDFFYNPVTAIQLLAHEIGHYVGERYRNERAKLIFKSLSVLLFNYTKLAHFIATADPVLDDSSLVSLMSDALAGYLFDAYSEWHKKGSTKIRCSIQDITDFWAQNNHGLDFFKDPFSSSDILRRLVEAVRRELQRQNTLVCQQFLEGLTAMQNTLSTTYYTSNPFTEDSVYTFCRSCIRYLSTIGNNTNVYSEYISQAENVIRAFSEALADLRMIEACGSFQVERYETLFTKMTTDSDRIQLSIRHDAICKLLAEDDQSWEHKVDILLRRSGGGVPFYRTILTITDYLTQYLQQCHQNAKKVDAVVKALEVFQEKNTIEQSKLIHNVIFTYRNKLCQYLRNEYHFRKEARNSTDDPCWKCPVDSCCNCCIGPKKVIT